MEDKLYFKVTNEWECHNGFQYFDGLNILKEPFNETGSCVPGGLYFTDKKNIFAFLKYGINLREITLPKEDPEFKVLKDPSGGKWRANKIILGKKYDLRKTETFEFLISQGADIKATDNYALRWASRHGHLEVVKFLVSQGANVRAIDDFAIKVAAEEGHLEVITFLVSAGADIMAENNYALRWASHNGHLEVVKFLVSQGADIKDNRAVKWASRGGYLEVVKFLVECKDRMGAEILQVID